MARRLSTVSSRSASPQKVQTGSALSRSAVSGSPRPQMGTTAANRSGWAVPMSQLPCPPMERPVRITRFGSTL